MSSLSPHHNDTKSPDKNHRNTSSSPLLKQESLGGNIPNPSSLSDYLSNKKILQGIHQKCKDMLEEISTSNKIV
jgi:hypothetical protein